MSSHRRRTGARTAALFTAAALLAVPAPMAAARDVVHRPAIEGVEVAVETHAVVVTDGPGDEYADVTLDVDVYVPSTATAAAPAPVVVLAHGFGGNKSGYAALATMLASHGYLAVSYSSRGFGQSSHEIGLDSLHYDVKDVQQLIDWIAQRPDVLLDSPGDPRIGFHGDSYGGGITLQIATSDDRVDAIAPRITWSSLVYALSPNSIGRDQFDPYSGTIGFFKQQWTTLFFTLGTAQPVIDNNGFPTIPPTSECPGFVAGLCETYLRISAQGRGDEAARSLLAESSPDVRYDRLTVPTFVIQGEDDTLFTLRDGVRNYLAAKDNGAPVKMLWFNGGHSGSYAPGEIENEPNPTDVINRRLLAWWDRWLRGDTTVETGPEVEWFRDWVDHPDDDASVAYGAADAYPIYADTTLSVGAGVLGPTALPDTAQFANPPLGQPTAYSETASFRADDPREPFDLDGLHVAWESPPLPRAVELAGLPWAEVSVSSLTGEAAFFGKLYDVAPDGSTQLLRHHVAPVWEEDLSAPVVFTFPGMVHRFDEGHRIRLVLASTDAAYANRQLADTYTIDESATRLHLPLDVDPFVGQATTVGPAAQDGPAQDGPPATLPTTGGGLVALALVGLGIGQATRRRR